MAIPSIDLNLNADDIGVGLTLKTNDGKTIVLDAFSVKDAEPKTDRVRLDDVEIGDKLKLRGGRVLTVRKLHYKRKDEYACHASDGVLSLHYLKDGRSNLHGRECDVIGIIRAPISLKDAAIGDKFKVRDGRVFTVKRFNRADNTLLGGLENGCSLWFCLDGHCLGFVNGELDAISLTKVSKRKAPRVSIENVGKGDKLLTRDGRTFTCIGKKTGAGDFRTLDKDGYPGLAFAPDGSCPGVSYADIVKITPAPKPTLSDRISAALERSDAKIDRVVVSEDDWMTLTGESSDDCITSHFLGVPLKYSAAYEKGEFSLVFAAD